MSKKINIAIPNKIKPNLIDLFHTYLARKSTESRRSNSYDVYDEYETMEEYWNAMFPGWDEDITNDDDSDVVFPLNGATSNRRKGGVEDAYDIFWSKDSKKKNKHRNKGKKSKKDKVIDIYTPYSGEEDDLSILCENVDEDNELKEIWFYLDYHNKDDRMEFNTLKEFSDFCDRNGYYVRKEVAQDISWRYESHCCLIDNCEVVCEHSYGEMFYDVCETSELCD